MLCIRSCHSTMYVYIYIYRYGWLVEATHGSSHSPRTQPPPADLRVSSEDVIADPPRQFLVVRYKETGPKRTEPDDCIPEATCTHSKSTFSKKNQGGVRHGFIHRHRPQGTRLHEPPGQRHHQSLQWESQQALS